MNTESFKKFVRSKKFDTAIVIIGVIAGMFIVFHAGVEFGYKRAMYTNSAGDNYYRAFGASDTHGDGPMGGFLDDLSGGHGVAGTIASITGQTLTVEDHDGTEKVVRIESDTVIRKLRDTIQLSDLQVGDMIVAIGSPGDNGEIDAKLIRDLPPPATASDGTGTTTQPYQPTATAPQQTQPTP